LLDRPTWRQVGDGKSRTGGTCRRSLPVGRTAD
jgi:hypothetical protein